MCDTHIVAASPKGEPIQLHRRDIVRGLWAGTMVAFTVANSHECKPLTLHDRFNISKVGVNQTSVID